ncbi:cyclin-D4-1-like [Rhododendron vialii]|uniref:cyclin-D4-1-like n=1 Tax=Rhododendron vialii TaxID=182163 RepID=UPI00265EFDEE|nr:cyclin-D4-1-like [Rhododendron vialii]
MAPSFDCLLCGEDNIGIFSDEFGYGDSVEEIEPIWNQGHHLTNNQKGNCDGEEPLTWLPMQSDECLDSLLKRESDHLPKSDYLNRLRNGDLDLVARREAVDWIGKVHAHFNFGPLCLYLSISYLDRFLSVYELPKGKAWMMQLLAVACLSLAAKMEEAEIPLCVELQVGEARFVFEARTVQRMELLVLSILKWRMKAVTPFSFIDYFLRKINGDTISPTLLIYRSTQLILSIIKGFEFWEYRPSEVAAAVAISVGGGSQTTDTEKAIYLLTQHLEKDRVLKCIELLNESSNASVAFLPQSPIGVLDASACLSYKSDETKIGSCTNSSHDSPDSKRRKLNR